MGAVTFSIDLGLIDALKKALPLDVFVETGTFLGETVESVKHHFNEIHSVELSLKHYEVVRLRFTDWDNIDVACGDSAVVLARWMTGLQQKSVLYFLDAHWCAANDTAGQTSQCPLLNEIRSIGRLNDKSVIIIDDARLFLAPPLAPHEISHWPDFNSVISALQALNPLHQLMILNDTILFFPSSAARVLREYAQHYGVDWLTSMVKVRDYENLNGQFKNALGQLEEKDQAIQNLNNVCNEREQFIKQQQEALNYSLRCFFIHRLVRFFNRHTQRKLGKLIHHEPIPFQSWGLAPAITFSSPSELPLISIVTPSYQQGRFIGRTMSSVLNQNYPNLEYFVQDGGSTDNTVDLLKQYSSSLTGWESAPDEGQSQAINLGFKRVNGEIMAWLNSDDLLLPGTLAYVADFFNRNPDVDVVYGHRILIDEHDMEIGRWILPKHSNSALLWADFIPQETLFWRRSIWEKVGCKLDENFGFAMDWDLLLRFRKAGARMVRLPKFLGAFRVHNAQKTSSVINEVGVEEMAKLRLRELGRVVNSVEIRRNLAPYFLAHLLNDLGCRVMRRLGKF